jgi:hypothetical protein
MRVAVTLRTAGVAISLKVGEVEPVTAATSTPGAGGVVQPETGRDRDEQDAEHPELERDDGLEERSRSVHGEVLSGR